MNARTSKALRRALGFKPGEKRAYSHAPTVEKFSIGHDGRPKIQVVTGTITSTGARRQYQGAKRAGLAKIVTGAA